MKREEAIRRVQEAAWLRGEQEDSDLDREVETIVSVPVPARFLREVYELLARLYEA